MISLIIQVSMMENRLKVFLFLVSLTFGNDQIPGEDQKRPILLKGGVLHTVSTEVLEGYDILFA